MSKAGLLKLHRWVGLALALLFAIQATTGTLLVFRDEIERALHPELRVAAVPGPIALQPLVDAARRAAPDAKLLRIDLPDAPGHAAIAALRGTDDAPLIVALDPASGAVLRVGGYAHWPTEWLFRLHERLLAGEVGDVLVGIEGLALLFVLIVGLMSWWPGIRRLDRRAFRLVRGHGGLRLVQSLHRSLGAIAAIVLAVSATTGALMVFRPALQAVLPLAERPRPERPPRDGAPAPVDTLVAMARTRHGPLPLDQVRFHGAGEQVVALYFHDPDAWRRNATRQVYVDAWDGSELAVYDPARVPPANTLFDWLFTIHTGQAGHLPGRLLILAGGLSLLFFSISGPWLWLSARRKRRRRAGAGSGAGSAR